MDNTGKMLLFLYKDVGLFWEKQLSLKENSDMCSLVKSKNLKKFFKKNEIIYNVTNRNDLTKIEPQLNEFNYVDTKSSKIRSLMLHLRNSVMHGRYEISFSEPNETTIKFVDEYHGKINMKGVVNFKTLQQLIKIIKTVNR